MSFTDFQSSFDILEQI